MVQVLNKLIWVIMNVFSACVQLFKVFTGSEVAPSSWELIKYFVFYFLNNLLHTTALIHLMYSYITFSINRLWRRSCVQMGIEPPPCFLFYMRKSANGLLQYPLSCAMSVIISLTNNACVVTVSEEVQKTKGWTRCTAAQWVGWELTSGCSTFYMTTSFFNTSAYN